mgnify:CR=1 FL=1
MPDGEQMENEARNSHNPERHIRDAIDGILGDVRQDMFTGGLTNDLVQRLNREAEAEHVTYTRPSEKEIRNALLPVIEKLVKDNFKFDMSKYRYEGP